MQAVGDKLLARPALADNQHRLIQRRQSGNLLQHLNKAVRFAEESIFVICHDEIRHMLV